MNPGDVQQLIFGTVQGLIVSVIFLLALFVGFCVVLGFPKLRPTARGGMVVRSLDELVGGSAIFLPPDAPRGPVDQLRTPELLEQAARKET